MNLVPLLQEKKLSRSSKPLVQRTPSLLHRLHRRRLKILSKKKDLLGVGCFCSYEGSVGDNSVLNWQSEMVLKPRAG